MASAGPSYIVSNSSLLSNINNNSHGFSANGWFNIFLPAKFKFGTDVDYENQGKSQTFAEGQKTTVLNANVSKSFYKNDDLKLTLWANDILNQNRGFSRNVNGNVINQDTFNTIKRYFMLTVTWNFNSMNATTAKK